MIDMALLHKRGLTHENLKKWFKKDMATYYSETNPRGYPPPETITPEGRRSRLIDRIRQRIQEGREYNLQNYRVWQAINEAWDAPFKQISPTLVQDLMTKDPDDPAVEEQLNNYGLRDILEVTQDPKSGEKTIRNFNAPAFWRILVPLARSVMTIRWSKICNDRNREPFFDFTPAISNKLNRLRCDIIEARMKKMSDDYDYFNDLKQSTLYMLKFGISVEIPVEEWHSELQETENESEARRDADGEIIWSNDVPEGEAPDTVSSSRHMTKLVREGIRYYHPHPARTFFDRAYGPNTFNTDRGSSYLGCWKIVRYRDIKDNPKYWNKDQVSVGGSVWWWNGADAFMNVVYGNCTIKFPEFSSPDQNDRESRQVYNLYTQQYADNAVQLTEYFEKLVPKENGLGDYEYPVWFRFLVAADDTIIYAAPLPYCPVTYAGYDADDYQDRNSSLVLEALPFQDLFSNILSQHVLSLRQNTLNLTFIDQEAVTPNFIEKLSMMGDKLFSKINIIPFSSKIWQRKQLKPENVVQNYKLPKLDTQESIQALKLVLDILERVLVMSSQEVAQAASHEQTREEIRSINRTTSNRLEFTAQPIDRMLEAKKRQLYLGLMAYGEDEMWAEIPSATYVTKELLQKVGFTAKDVDETMILNKEEAVGTPSDNDSIIIRVDKSKIAVPLGNFAKQKDNNRHQQAENGANMLQFITGVAGNPVVFEAVGIEQLLELTNTALHMIGFPQDFRLKFTGKEPADQAQELQQMIAQVLEERLGPVETGVEKNKDALIELANEVEGLSNPDGMSAVGQ